MDCSLPSSSVHGILQQEYWSWLSPSSPGIEPECLKSALANGFFTFSTTWHWLISNILAPPFCALQVLCSVQFSHSVVSDSLWHHELHASPPCPLPTPRVHPNPCPLSQWYHPTDSSSVVPFSSCLQFSQHRVFFQWVSSSHQVVKVLEFQLQHQSFQWTPRTDFL